MTQDLRSHHSIESSNERSFGIVFAIFFAILSIYPVINKKDINLYLLILSIIILMIGIFKPSLLYYPNKIWFKFGIFLGKIVSPLVMGIIFFFTVTPTGIIMKLLRKDLLKKKLDVKVRTYWVKKNKYTGSLRNQF
tara:strand:- start:796 stop:1203 length:408 start_codon:yes stop_codon:yes gene_type:complete